MIYSRQKVCQRVKEVRESIAGKGRTQRKFAEKILKIPYTTYREYERNIVNEDFLQMLCDIFDYRIEYLLLGQNPPKKH